MDTRDRRLVITIGVLLLMVLSGIIAGWGMMRGGAVGWGAMGPGMMNGYAASPSIGGGWTWGRGMVVGSLAMVAFWGVLIVGAILLVRWLAVRSAAGRGGAGAPSAASGEGPLDILRRRYAAGEITQEEFEHLRQTVAA